MRDERGGGKWESGKKEEVKKRKEKAKEEVSKCRWVKDKRNLGWVNEKGDKFTYIVQRVT